MRIPSIFLCGQAELDGPDTHQFRRNIPRPEYRSRAASNVEVRSADLQTNSMFVQLYKLYGKKRREVNLAPAAPSCWLWCLLSLEVFP